MPFIAKHSSPSDWCHICGKRSATNADVWYPQNAEHATKQEHTAQLGANIKYIRVCASCAGAIQHAAL